jgi:hypothetical protein
MAQGTGHRAQGKKKLKRLTAGLQDRKTARQKMEN